MKKENSKKIKKELSTLLRNGDENQFKDKFLDFKQSFFTKDEMEDSISDFILVEFKNLEKDLKVTERLIEIQEKLKPIKGIVSLSYIAKNYFGKSASWLQQRIYGYKVGGKTYTLSDEEVKILSFAFQDISEKLKSIKL